MSIRRASPVDMQEPSTSTAPPQRIQENLRLFNKFCAPGPVTLWEICSPKQNRHMFKQKYHSELQALRGISFSNLLNKFRDELSDLATLSGTTFKELCSNLKFFAYYKADPFFETNRHGAKELFENVCNCICFEGDRWFANFDRTNLFEPVSMEILKSKRKATTEKVKYDFEKKYYELQERRRAAGLPSFFEAPSTSSKPPNAKPTPMRAPKLQMPPPTWKPPPRPFRCQDDVNLREMHRLQFITMDSKFCSSFERSLKQIIKNNSSVRTKPVELSDLEYYGDDELLTTSTFSLKMDTVAQVPKFSFPKAEADGYFSPDRTDYMWYLFQKYIDANEQCAAEYAVIRAPETNPIREEFDVDTLSPQECYNFHIVGRHIHGFFDVWIEKERKWQDLEGKWVSRRYLVDKYNRMMFPLYVDWQYWPVYLKWSFDKYSLYGLRLRTFIKKYPTLIQEAGERVFAPYPQLLIEINHHELITTKQLHHFANALHVENSRSFPMTPSMNQIGGYIDDEIRRRKRKPRYSEDELMHATPPAIDPALLLTPEILLLTPPPIQKHRPSPRKSIEVTKQLVVKQQTVKLPVQKENITTPAPIVVPNVIPKVTPPKPVPQLQRTPTIPQRTTPILHRTPAIPLKVVPAKQLTPPVLRTVPTTPMTTPRLPQTPQMAATSSPGTSSATKTTPPSAQKRRLPEDGKEPAVRPPPIKRIPAHDSWDDHVHNSIDEEHVDEKEERMRSHSDSDDDSSSNSSSPPFSDDEEPMIVEERPAIWVPTETGLQPEEYADKIMDHYPKEKRAAQLALLAQQQAAGMNEKPKRKKSSKGADSKDRPPPKALPLLMPSVLLASRLSTSSGPLTTASPAPLGPPASLANGNLLVPPGKTVAKRVVQLKTPVTQGNRGRTVYPVKKLMPSTSTPSSSSAVPNASNSVTVTTSRPMATPMNPRMVYQKTPFSDYPTSMRSKPLPPLNPTQVLPLAPQNQNRSTPPVNPATPAAKTIANGTPKVLPRSQPRSAASNSQSKQQIKRPVLEGQGLANQRLKASIQCQRVTPINVQFAIHAQYKHDQKNARGQESAYEQREWPPKPKSAKPPTTSTPTVPSVQRTLSNTSSGSVSQRPRSFSNTSQPQAKRIPPIAAPTVASLTPTSNAVQRTVGVAKTRPETLSVPNNRAKMTTIRATVTKKVDKILRDASLAMKASAKKEAIGLAAAAASMVTEPVNTVETPQELVSVKVLTAKIRKENGKMTPEQIAVAIRNETQKLMKGDGEGEKEATDQPVVQYLNQ